MARSRYRAEGTSDYSHRFHAGNVGDVWKHCILLDVLHRCAHADQSLSYVETHAGEGRYVLGPTGEWSEGIGRLWDVDADTALDEPVASYLDASRACGSGYDRPRVYPGSPLLARHVLPGANMTLCERDADACERLRSVLGEDERTRFACGDGLDRLPDLVRAADTERHRTVVLIDPPYTEKADWTLVPDAVIAAAHVSQHSTLLLWYPVKSLTRPNAMVARLEAAGVHATLAELITTPLAHQRQRLNGSGMILVRPPAGTVPSIARAAATIGPRCATREGVWSARIVSW